MPAKDLIIDFDEYNLDHVVANIDDIRRYNQQRFEMEQLTAIVYEDTTRHICVGYKDYRPDEFWCRGHMPGNPVLPGVLMCEAAAQLCSYYVGRHDLLGAGVVGFGGLDEVRFRDMVVPGDRLVVICSAERLRRGAMVVSWFQEFVGRTLVCDGRIRGVPLHIDASAPQRQSSAT